jgi:hypothetical protein
VLPGESNETLRAVTSSQLVGYLRSHGWTIYSERPAAFSVWHRRDNEDAEVTVPLAPRSRDHLPRIAEAIKEIARVESRSTKLVLDELLVSNYDVFRIRSVSSSSADGTIRIEDGVSLFDQARELLLSAACATVQPRAVFLTRKLKQATDYLETARLGQTSRGSFILTVLSPVTPQLGSADELFPTDPFERRVMLTLARALASAVSAAQEVANSDHVSFGAFETAVAKGVSANLCEAAANLFSSQDVASIDFSFAWAGTRPVLEDVPNQIAVSNEVAPILREAARTFREAAPLTSISLVGPVIKLERKQEHEGGVATIVTAIEDSLRKVTLSLSEEDYVRATEAHKQYRQIRVVGDVNRSGRSYSMPTVVAFAVDGDETDILDMFSS